MSLAVVFCLNAPNEVRLQARTLALIHTESHYDLTLV